MKYYEYQFSVGRHISRINKIETNSGDYLIGLVFTAFGAVSVYSQGSGKSAHSTRLELLSGKTVLVRQISKSFSRRGLIIQAKRFAREIIENE